MIFACSGIPVPRGIARQHLTRFVTSAHLVREFKRYRNIDDKLRVAVRLSDKKTTDGFLGLYDDDIAIVTVLAAGRAYMVPSLMAMHGSLCRVCTNTWIPEYQHMNKAVLGGPLLQQNDARFLGMIYELYDNGDTIVRYWFLPLELLRERLEHFGILNTNNDHTIASGFMTTINRIKARGYPMPPPLVLEFNGQLLNRFEERFGELLAWKGFPYGHQTSFLLERVWNRLPKKVVKDISRWNMRSFVCTGFLIKWHGSKATRTVILTSASLVRDHDNKDVIDKTLKIEVFLPPNQRGSGTLEFYNLSYNIAVVSVKNFNAVRTEDIFCKSAQKPSDKVVAIGRDTKFGLLMATIGEVKRTSKGSNVVCKGIWVSTCPLINFDGDFVGMNFYDGTEVTPLLPKHKIVQVLRGVINFPLPSESEYDHPEPFTLEKKILDDRWPVAKLYWYHGALDVSRYHVPELIGRQLH
ncbi:hypothetical protein PVAP13_2KG203391 [Panicum virgatum]|uniref:Uncharacterized protein n=1 Tax=Panicum virgatum TaxID=38727 RepID=A0A8T0WGY4_PANVG|nr:hypothetical protein PVAP13_2KG203391 [Panicum virgatum]